MAELIEIKKDIYEKFVENHPLKSHFLQSYYWGEFSKKKKNLTPYYLGLYENKKLVGACLLLEKKLPLGYSYFYSPRGFVIDFTDVDLLKKMTINVLEFTKKHRSIFLKIDPDIVYKKYNYLEEEVKLDYNPQDIFKSLKNLGFKHLGFTKNFETMQPRYTFRVDLNNDMDTIINHFSKTTKQRINKSQKLNTIVEIGTEKDIKEFYHLMTLTETRKDFVSYNLDYYETLYEIFNGNKNSKATLFLGKVDIDKTLEAFEKTLKNINNQISILPIDNLSKSAKNKLNELTRQKDHTKEQIKKFEKYKEQYGNLVTLSAHMIIEYGDKAWVLYAGNHNILTDTYVNYNTYYEHLLYCKKEGLKIYDQFGTIGDLSKDNPRIGLHEFKKKFGGDYVEFIGEFDYIINKPMYFVFTKLVPLYRKIIKNKSKKELKHEVNRTK